MPFRKLLGSLGIGRLVYTLWHRRADVGPSGEDLMRERAATLEPLGFPECPLAWPVCRFLTGEAFWHQTVFCARSFEVSVGFSGRFEFYDDGSLSETSSSHLTRLFPGSRVISSEESMARVDQFLPRSGFPALRDELDHVPLMKKLLFLRAGAKGSSLFLDSDMLFFKRPDALISWLGQPRDSFYLWDQITSYIAPPEEIDAVSNGRILRHVNTGLLALDDDSFDWAALEDLVQKLPPSFRHHRLLEQTLTAVHLTSKKSAALPRESYSVVFERFYKAPDATLLHYCWHTKWIYTNREWKRFLKTRYTPALCRLAGNPSKH